MITRSSIVAVLLGILCNAAVSTVVAQEDKSSEHSKAAPTEKAESHPTAEGGHGKAAGEHHADVHHDETDLGHGNATAGLTSLVDPRFDMSIYTFLVFLVLLALLYKFAWGPISHALDQREETILRQIAEAKAASEKAALQLQEYEARLAAATEEARQIVGQARKDAEVAKEKIVAEAQAAAAKERDRAVADITTAKNQALHEIAEKSVATAISLASGIIRREVKPEDHDQLINQSLQQFTSLN